MSSFEVGDAVVYKGTYIKDVAGEVKEVQPECVAKYRVEWEGEQKANVSEWQTGKYLTKL